ncbi:phage minor head protein [Alphaproteobacteria bacterium]|nr:phage minor head protein [Alphaproteobacteria bacterium]
MRAIKTALNHLGYYTPPPRIGIEENLDVAMFNAVNKFQRDNGLLEGDHLMPHDATMRKLNEQLNQQDKTGRYIWRTVKDDRVRDDHAEREGKIFLWGQPPEGGHPGEDFNCRCWMESIKVPIPKRKPEQPEIAEQIEQIVISTINDSPERWGIPDFLYHFYRGNGRTVTLSEIGHLKDALNNARTLIFPRVENQVIQKARAIRSGKIIDSFEKAYDFSDVSFVHGDSTIKGKIEGRVTHHRKYLLIEANIEYQFFDEFTDPINSREDASGSSSTEGLSDEELKKTDLGGQAFLIIDRWLTRLTAVVLLKP